jgi:outer membrane protein assembly factor BamB
MVRTSAGELAIAGQIKSPQTQGIDACLLKVDQKGKQLWFRSFPGPLDEMTMWVDEAADGGFVLIGNLVDPNAPIADSGAAGYIGYDGRSSICLIRTDRDGQELWRRTYDRGQNMITTSGLPTPDGGTLILATIMYFPQPDNDICLFKVDATGTELWSRTWSEGQRYGSRLICCADGNYLITGSYLPGQVTDASQMDLLFIKTDPAGETIWERILGDPRRADKGSVLAQTADGGYVAAGDRTRDLFARDGHNSLVKIDGEGQLVWRQNWPAKHTMYSALFQHEDGGYVIAGSTTVDDVGCMVLIKTKPEGAHEGR